MGEISATFNNLKNIAVMAPITSLFNLPGSPLQKTGGDQKTFTDY